MTSCGKRAEQIQLLGFTVLASWRIPTSNVCISQITERVFGSSLLKSTVIKQFYFKDECFVLKRRNPVLEKKTITWSYLFSIGKVQVHFIPLWNKIPFRAGQYACKSLNIRLFRQLCQHNYRNSSV